MAHTQKNTKIIFLAVLLRKLFVLIIILAGKLFFTEEKMKSMITVKEMIKKHFNKNLIMSEEEEERFQLSNR